MKLVHKVRFVCAVLLPLPVLLLLFVPVIALPPAQRYTSRWFYWGCSWYARTALRIAGIEYTLHGAENLAALASRPSVIVLNHQSILDAVVAEAILSSQPRIAISNDYSRIPLFGQILSRMHVLVQRVTARSSHKALDEMVAIAGPFGNHAIIFPEGTRYADGKIHTFYRGFTVLAEQLNRPVVPIFLYGLHKIMPRGSFWPQVNAANVTIIIGNPFIFNPTAESREEFLEKVHNWFTLECTKVSHNL
jgi:1-acyl-sn-glycerol-3-phosphate acyltransferase